LSAPRWVWWCGGEDHELDRSLFIGGPVLISGKKLGVLAGTATEADVYDAVLFHVDELQTYLSDTGDEEFVVDELTATANDVGRTCPSCADLLDRELLSFGTSERPQ
jgi:hypothetical protein